MHENKFYICLRAFLLYWLIVVFPLERRKMRDKMQEQGGRGKESEECSMNEQTSKYGCRLK